MRPEGDPRQLFAPDCHSGSMVANRCVYERVRAAWEASLVSPGRPLSRVGRALMLDAAGSEVRHEELASSHSGTSMPALDLGGEAAREPRVIPVDGTRVNAGRSGLPLRGRRHTW